MNVTDQETNILDIRSNGLYPSGVLSNLCSNGFRFDGMVCGSMEGFLQSLKRQNMDKQRQICSMKGGNARKMSVASWQTDQIVWWKGVAIDRQGKAYQDLLRKHSIVSEVFRMNQVTFALQNIKIRLWQAVKILKGYWNFTSRSQKQVVYR